MLREENRSGSLRTGLGFGLTSGVITTLGLIIGLYAGTHSKIAIISGVATIAFVDSFSDAFGMHISMESKKSHTSKDIWMATLSTLLFKIIFSSIFILPFIFLPISMGVALSLVCGFSLLIAFSFFLAKEKNESALKIVGEHVLIAFFVLFFTFFLGSLIDAWL